MKTLKWLNPTITKKQYNKINKMQMLQFHHETTNLHKYIYAHMHKF